MGALLAVGFFRQLRRVGIHDVLYCQAHTALQSDTCCLAKLQHYNILAIPLPV
jgi:hypothetical protein